MTLIFYAQPYDISAEGFYFRDKDEYDKNSFGLKSSYGHLVEEFEIQFIDGEQIDCELAKAWGLNQASFSRFIIAANEWDEERKLQFIIAVGECGYSHDLMESNPDSIEIDIYRLATMKELAEQFYDDGLFGDIPERLQYYIDFDAIARDLSVDYSQAEIAGQRLIYRCS